jgi:hypothetical protein
MTADPAELARARLVTPAFVALAAATVAFFIAGGLVLPIAPRFAKLARGADASGFGIAPDLAVFNVARCLLGAGEGIFLVAALVRRGSLERPLPVPSA